MHRELQRMIPRSALIRAAYDLRAKADAAAKQAAEARDPEDAEFHTGRQAGILTALNAIAGVLDSEL